MTRKSKMDKLPERSRVGRMALDVLVVAVPWNVILLLMDYPREDWIGVVAVGYISTWIARVILSYPLTRVMEHSLQRLRTLAESQGIDLPEPPMSVKSLPLKAQLRIAGFGLSLICALMAISVALTGVIIGFASLAPLAPGTMPIAVAVAVVGTAITAWWVGAMYFTIAKRQRELNAEKIHRQGQYVGGLLGRLAVAMSL